MTEHHPPVAPLAGDAEQKAKEQPALLPESDGRTCRLVPIAAITIGEQMVRHDPNDDDVVELAASIAAHGLRNPIELLERGDGLYQLIAGSRRLAAHVRLRRPVIEATVLTDHNVDIVGYALEENLQRRQMTLEEEISAVDRMHHQGNKSPDQIADLVGKGRAWVLRRLAVPSLPPELRDPVLDGSLSLGAAEVVSLIPDEGARRFVLNQICIYKLTVTQVRAMVDSYLTTPSIAEAVNAGVAHALQPVIDQQLYMECAVCKRRKKINDLILIRVCKDDCKDDDAQAGSAETRSPTHA